MSHIVYPILCIAASKTVQTFRSHSYAGNAFGYWPHTVEQESQAGNRQQDKTKRRPSFHMPKTWLMTPRSLRSSLFPTKQQLRRPNLRRTTKGIFAFKPVLFWPSWSSAKERRTAFSVCIGFCLLNAYWTVGLAQFRELDAKKVTNSNGIKWINYRRKVRN